MTVRQYIRHYFCGSDYILWQEVNLLCFVRLQDLSFFNMVVLVDLIYDHYY